MRVIDQLEAIVDAVFGPAEDLGFLEGDVSDDAPFQSFYEPCKTEHARRMRRLRRFLPTIVTHVLFVHGTELVRSDDVAELSSLGITCTKIRAATSDGEAGQPRYHVDSLIHEIAAIVSGKTHATESCKTAKSQKKQRKRRRAENGSRR